jgi:hypothetical protein
MRRRSRAGSSIDWTIVTLDRRTQKRSLRLFAIARMDVHEALVCAQILQRLQREAPGDPFLPMKQEIFFPVQNAMVVSYARPFVPTRTSQRLQGRWARFDDQRLQVVHDLVIRTRHDFVAHSDEEQRTVTIVPAGYVVPGVGRPSGGLGLQTSSIAFSAETVDTIVDCCMDVGFRVTKEVDRLRDELYLGRSDLPATPFPVSDNDGI